MKKIIQIPLAILFLFLTACQPEKGILYPKKIDFGSISKKEKCSMLVPFTNYSSQNLTIIKSATSCSCISESRKNEVIGPDETVYIKIGLDLHNKSSGDEVNEKFTLRTDSEKEFFDIEVVASIKP